MVEVAASEEPRGYRVFQFSRYCNSSRLHLGGRVVIVFRIVSSEGLELARPATAPVVLHAKTSYMPSPRTLKWKDSTSDDGDALPWNSMADVFSPGPQSPVFLRVSSPSVNRCRPFEVVCIARTEWMAANRLERESIRIAGVRAQAYREGSPDKSPLEPCPRCCAPRHRQNIFVSPEMTEISGSEAQPGFRIFRFSSCFSYCNSSRLHLGGRVVIVFRIVNSEGLELARATTEPLVLHAKTSYVPVPRNLKWMDSIPRASDGPHDSTPPMLQHEALQEVQQKTPPESMCCIGELTQDVEQEALVLQIRALQIVCLVRPDWMSERGLESEAIVHVSPEMTESAGALAGYRVFRYCNSSRLHLGGRVVVVFRLAGSDGSELARVATEPLMLHAKSNYVPVPRTLKWKDSAPRFAVGVAQEDGESTRGAEGAEQQSTPEAVVAEQTPEAREDREEIVRQIRALQALQTDQLARIRALDMALRGDPSP
eukprot:m51a1_g14562 hypothetical protein (484) ;mRNA; r:1036076-1039942